MTRDEILAMEPGRELDALVAEHVMGWTQYEYYDRPDAHNLYPLVTDGYPSSLILWVSPNMDGRKWSPSTDISVAWEVFELNGYQGHISYSSEEYYCSLWSRWDEKGNGVHADSFADSAPLAICRAALLTTLREDG